MASVASSDEAPDREAGRLLFAQSCTFVGGAARAEQFPDSSLPEIAFAGRSNVGKSSLINALTGHKSLARTSNTPGRTQQLNFFDLGGRLMIADLPGHGFARAPKEVVEQWTALVRTYLEQRAQLRRACLLVDARHGLKDIDREVMDLLDRAAASFQIVLTKCDKVPGAELADRSRTIAEEIASHPAAYPDVAATSALKSDGIAELRAALAALAEESQNR